MRAAVMTILVLGVMQASLRGAEAPATPTVTVFAAASTREVMEDLAATYARAHGVHVVISLGGSGTLARQIEAGAPADCFLSADEAWMDHVAAAHALRAGSRSDLLGNALVLITPASGIVPTIVATRPLAPQFTGRLAIADPDTVPAGRYAVAALRSLGWWDGVRDRLAPAADVRAALRLVAIRACTLGIVYASDARIEPRVHAVWTVPASAHPPIRYPVALTTHAVPQAAAFVAFLASPAASARFAAAGFIPLAVAPDAARPSTTGSPSR